MSHKVLIIGAGFAGMNAAHSLAKNKNLEITIVDRRNHHLFQPLLYQVATAGLSPADIATPIRSLFTHYSNVRVLLDEAIEFNPDRNWVKCHQETLNYDYLVLACGANHSYFGKPEWESFAPGLKTLEQATEIRRRILDAFEEAEKEIDPIKQKDWLNFVIVGGGPTGVELAGAIAELSKRTIRNEFRNIDPTQARILLIEAGSRVLAAFDESLSRRAVQDLNRLGVEVRTQTKVTEVKEDGVQTDKEWIPSHTAIWAAGVAPSITGKQLKGSKTVELDRSGRVVVESDLSLKNYPNIFVIGDQASVAGKDGKPLPGLAPVAMQAGRHAARNILKRIRNQTTKPFSYLDKGIMATIGRKSAVIQVNQIKIGGIIAWLGWLFIHIYYLIGFRNRFFVFLQWTWSYLTFSKGARLIVDKDWHLKG